MTPLAGYFHRYEQVTVIRRIFIVGDSCNDSFWLAFHKVHGLNKLLLSLTNWIENEFLPDD
jgi:hypothetical protein